MLVTSKRLNNPSVDTFVTKFSYKLTTTIGTPLHPAGWCEYPQTIF
jgi:hypothetical protein